MEEERLIERSKSMGEQLMHLMKEILSHSNVGDIRQKGLLMGIELVEDKLTREPLNTGKVNQIIASCKSLGVLIGKNGDTVAGFNNVLTIAPPLTISTKQVQHLTDAIKKSIKEVCKR
jgi:4-aminobutyrate aminotransferase-like enzyme